MVRNSGPAGDMLAEVFDPNGKVEEAGGIPTWCPQVIVSSSSAAMPTVVNGALLIRYTPST